MARRVLVIGGGGREHALAWKIAQSPKVEKVCVAPGNAGTAHEPKCDNVAIAAEDVDGLLRFAQQNKIDLTVVGPEAPLVWAWWTNSAPPACASSARAIFRETDSIVAVAVAMVEFINRWIAGTRHGCGKP